jgi:hypothetical protein
MSTMMRFAAVLILSLLHAAVGQEDADFLWASSGGGWRAQTACMAYSNIFTQAGLITPDSSLLSAVSTQSGASWFSTQFFYSQQFFENTALSTPDELYDFVLSWMDSYQSMNTTTNFVCDFLDRVRNTTHLDVFSEYCNILLDYEGDWAAFMSAMYKATSTDYGDADLVDRPVNAQNRVTAMSDTKLLVQTSLVANSRIRQETNTSDTVAYLGPSGTADLLNSIPVCVDWTVTNDGDFYFTNQQDASTTPSWGSHTGETSKTFSFDDWEDFYLYPAENGQVSIPVLTGTAPVGQLQQPFFSSTQAPTVGQIGAASSAFLGVASGVNPSTLAQLMSFQRNQIMVGNKTADEKVMDLEKLTSKINTIYGLEILDDLAVCTQWPAECGDGDGRFIDGYVTDDVTLALNIGLHQMSSNGNLSKTLKVILCNNNVLGGLPIEELAYFNTTFNQGVEPGAFIWPTLQDQHLDLPLYSPQIFDSYLDLDMLNDITEPIEGINVTTALIKTTTIDNPAFHTRAGQPVEILLVSGNSAIPTAIAGETQIEQWKVPLAEMARDIAASQVLLSRVKAFMMEGTDSGTSSNGARFRVSWILHTALLVTASILYGILL